MFKWIGSQYGPKFAGMVALLLATSWGAARAGEGAVYMMTNEVAGNELAVFARGASGLLDFPAFVQTGGIGSGKGLGSQGSIAIDDEGDFLYVVNAASATISVFDLSGKLPKLIQVVPSGGAYPISIALSDRLLYVLNAGGSGGGVDAIAGFKVAPGGKISPLPYSTRSLSAASVLPAQVSFSPDNKRLIVTERNTKKIDVFLVLADGQTFGPVISPSPGADAFGFLFDAQGHLVVTEANFAAPPGSVSSYEILEDGTAEVITQSLVTGTQLAACWVAITANGKYIYTVNTASASLSALTIDHGTGTLTLLNPVGFGGLAGLLPPGSLPTDLAILGNDFLYVNVANTNQIAAFKIEKGGSLSELFLSPAGVLPGHPNGLIVR